MCGGVAPWTWDGWHQGNHRRMMMVMVMINDADGDELNDYDGEGGGI
jgi:hypothetical protein